MAPLLSSVPACGNLLRKPPPSKDQTAVLETGRCCRLSNSPEVKWQGFPKRNSPAARPDSGTPSDVYPSGRMSKKDDISTHTHLRETTSIDP